MQQFIKAGLWSVSIIGFSSLAQAAVQPEHVRTIDQTVQMALASHPKLLASQQQSALSAEQLKQIESAFLPNISMTLGIGREDSNNASSRALNGSGSVEMERREATLQLSQMLFDGFETDNLRNGQLQELEAENWALQDIASELTLRAIKAHLQVATSNQLLSDHLENLKVHEQIAKDIGVRVRSGKDDRARVSQISARLSLALANLEAARSEVLSANADYFREVGALPGQKLTSQDGLIPMPETEQTLLENVLNDHPLLQSRLKALEARQFQEKASRSHALPEIYLESGASWNANIDAVRGRNSDAFVMLRMRYDLFRGGADLSAQREAAYAAQQVRFELDDLRRELKREASRSWFSYQSNTKRVSFLQDYVESAEATKLAYVKQFNIGQRSLIDLLDAENELLRARIQWHEARESLALSKYQIVNLQGGLLSLFNVQTDSMPMESAVDQHSNKEAEK